MKINKQSYSEVLYSMSFLNSVVMVFYTMIHSNGGLGLLVSFMIGPFFLIPQLLLYFLKNKKRNSVMFLIFKIVLVILGFCSTFTMFSFTSEPINIFIIFNFILLLIILVTIVKDYKK